MMWSWPDFFRGLWRRTYERLPFLYIEETDTLANLTRGFLGEFFGITVWLFLACGSVPAVEATLGTLQINPDSLLVISLSFGLGIVIPIYMMAETSGSHFNPIVSTAAWFLQKISLMRLFLYVVAQLAGSIVASCLLLFFVVKSQETVSALGATHIAPGIEWIKGMYIEGLLSTILVFCVIGLALHPFGRSSHPREEWDKIGPGIHTGIIVGFVIALLNVVGIPLTGASMNPARSFGPALVSWDWDGHMIYWLGPYCGCVIGTVLALFMIARPEGRLPGPRCEMAEFDTLVSKH